MKQMTVLVDDKKIKIVAKLKTSLGNPVGYNVTVNDKKYFFAVLHFSEAMDLGYIKYVKETRKEGMLMSKNLCGKTRDIENPYEVWISKDATWEWRVLKKYQTPEKEQSNPYAKWFCGVKSPYTHGTFELGDCYINDIISFARMVKGQPNLASIDRPYDKEV